MKRSIILISSTPCFCTSFGVSPEIRSLFRVTKCWSHTWSAGLVQQTLHAYSFRWNLTKCSQGWPPFWKPYVQVPCIKFQYYFTCHETPIFPSLTNRNLTGEHTCQGVPSRGEGRRCSTVEFCWMVAQLDGPDLRCSVIMNDNGVFGGICVVDHMVFSFFQSKLCWDTSHLLVSWLVHVVIRNLLPTDHVFCLKCWLKLWIRAPGNMDQPSPPWLGMSRTMALWEVDLMENSRPESATRMSRVKINSVKIFETESHWKRTDLHFWEIIL